MRNSNGNKRKPSKPGKASKPSKPATRYQGDRPKWRVVVKRPDGDFTAVLAWWLDPETGYPRGGLDSRVAAIKIQTTDGEVVTVRRDPETGHHKGGFVNLYIEEQPDEREGGSDAGGDDDGF